MRRFMVNYTESGEEGQGVPHRERAKPQLPRALWRIWRINT